MTDKDMELKLSSPYASVYLRPLPNAWEAHVVDRRLIAAVCVLALYGLGDIMRMAIIGLANM